jgi:hypothetical protein
LTVKSCNHWSCAQSLRLKGVTVARGAQCCSVGSIVVIWAPGLVKSIEDFIDSPRAVWAKRFAPIMEKLGQISFRSRLWLLFWRMRGVYTLSHQFDAQLVRFVCSCVDHRTIGPSDHRVHRIIGLSVLLPSHSGPILLACEQNGERFPAISQNQAAHLHCCGFSLHALLGCPSGCRNHPRSRER